MTSSMYFIIISEKVDFLPEGFLSIINNSFLNLSKPFLMGDLFISDLNRTQNRSSKSGKIPLFTKI